MFRHSRSVTVTLALVVLLSGVDGGAEAQTREILEGAKKEGELVFYSGIPVPDGKMILAAFEKKYPFIRTTHYRATGAALISRIQSERRAGKHAWDVVNATGFEPYALLEQGYLARYDSPERKHFPEGHKDAEGYWTTMYTSPNLPSYNTRIVPPQNLPRGYGDLLDSKWKGKLGLDVGEIEWYANLRKLWGAEKARGFLEGLRKQELRLIQGRSLLTELLAAGEVSLLVNNYLQNVLEAKRKGSPVEWLAFDPVVAGAGLIGINHLAPHPYAARLFVDFVLSREGQELIVKSDRSSVRKDVSGNPLDLLRNARIVPSDLHLAKEYVQYRNEYRELLGIR